MKDEETQVREMLERDHQKAIKKSAADRDFAIACKNAKDWTRDLQPNRDADGQLVYAAQQTQDAACHAREDVSAVLQLQLPILKRLDMIEKIAMACLALLVYIAFKL